MNNMAMDVSKSKIEHKGGDLVPFPSDIKSCTNTAGQDAHEGRWRFSGVVIVEP